MQISAASRNLPVILALLEKGWTWDSIEETNNIYADYYGTLPEKIYPYELGGSGLNVKVVSFLSPFMQYCYTTITDYLMDVELPYQEAIKEYRNTPQWAYNLYPRNVYRDHEVLGMDYISIDEPLHKNLEVIFPTFALFFYTYGENGITHTKKEN